MNDFLSSAQSFTKKMTHLFLAERNMEQLAAGLAPEISWFGTGEHAIGKDWKNVIAFIAKHIKAHPSRLDLAHEWYVPIQASSDICCVVMGVEVTTNEEEGMIFTLNVRGSWVIKQYPDQTLKAIHVHMSVPDISQLLGEMLPRTLGQDNFFLLQQLLHEKTAEINNFYNLLSGGVCKIAFDAHYTLLYASNYLLEMFGYTQEDLQAQNNQTFAYIFEDDLPTVTRQIQQAAKTGKRFSCQYRIKHGNGSLLWVNVNGIFTDELYQNHIPVYYCIYTDITELINTYEQITLEKERYRIITELTEGITFEYNLVTDTMAFPNKYEQYFNGPPVIDDFQNYIQKSCFATKNDYHNYKTLCQSLTNGKTHGSTEVRLRTRDGSWLWFSIMLSTLCNEQGVPIKAIGKLSNINEQKLQQQDLENKAQLDAMTNLYNKASTKHQIRSYLAQLQPDTMAALLMIDIDHFKTINDTLGHFVGDHVIQLISDEMKKIFNQTDILGRFGGDEFLVLMKDLYTESIVLEKASLLGKNITKANHLTDKDCPISLSIGIAMVNGKRLITDEQLFQNADKALYVAKNNGKNRFEMYTPAMEKVKMATKETAATRQLAIQKKSYPTIINTILDILLHKEHTKHMFTDILCFIGNSLDISRTYIGIFEQNKLKIVHQWSHSGYPLLPTTIQLDKKSFRLYFNNKGIFSCNDTDMLELPLKKLAARFHAGAMLQCLIWKNNQCIGFIGFDCSRKSWIWTQNEIDILQTITKILTNHVAQIIIP